MRYIEEKHQDDTRRLWMRIAALTVAVGMVLGEGFTHLMDVIQWFAF